MANFRKLIDEASDYVKVDLDDDDGSESENRIKSALNEAVNLIARRFKLNCVEDVYLDSDGCFDPATLSHTLLGIIQVSKDGSLVASAAHGSLILCDAEHHVTVAYSYIPEELADDADEFPFPDAVSHRIACCFAAARFYEIKGTATSLNKYRYWMNEFETGLKAIGNGSPYERKRIRAVYAI